MSSSSSDACKSNTDKLISALDALELKESKTEHRTDSLIDAVTKGRDLPSSYVPTLRRLANEADSKLVEALSNCSLSQVPDRIDSVVIDELNKEWERIFAECTTSQAKSLATTEKTNKSLNSVSLVYGEVHFKSLVTVLLKTIKFKPGGAFYDMGSGSGRGVFLAAVLHNFDKYHGIEYLAQLTEASQTVLSRYNTTFRKAITERHQLSSPKKEYSQNIILENNDFRGYDLHDATLVFANSTCFDEDLMKSLSSLCEKMDVGSYVVTFTKQLDSSHFKIIYSKQHEMSWGLATVIVHQKIRAPVQEQEEKSKASGNELVSTSSSSNSASSL
eukprot:TRINITY_DN7486_c0_g1_i1.p1 TRINITY_DN7486_c0_g1~~TRINITY_DN7486_c0_g1_i1.p1  ORF type:complete len:331 (-),score=75.70 TRINITY_DN7486_c0_g1_i1:1034-2026(-)